VDISAMNRTESISVTPYTTYMSHSTCWRRTTRHKRSASILQ